jgi:hypothetical protein
METREELAGALLRFLLDIPLAVLFILCCIICGGYAAGTSTRCSSRQERFESSPGPYGGAVKLGIWTQLDKY